MKCLLAHQLISLVRLSTYPLNQQRSLLLQVHSSFIWKENSTTTIFINRLGLPQPPLNPRSVLLVGGMTSERRSCKRTSVRKRPHQLRNMCTHGARKERRTPDLSLTRSSRKAARSRMHAIMMMIAEELAHANTKHIHTHDARMSRCCLRCRMRWRYKLPALSGEIGSSQGVG